MSARCTKLDQRIDIIPHPQPPTLPLLSNEYTLQRSRRGAAIDSNSSLFPKVHCINVFFSLSLIVPAFFVVLLLKIFCTCPFFLCPLCTMHCSLILSVFCLCLFILSEFLRKSFSWLFSAILVFFLIVFCLCL
jgi:hypothetical protein